MMCAQNENINKEILIIKRDQAEILEVKIIITEMKNSLPGFNSIFEQTEEKFSELEDRTVEICNVRNRQKKNKINIQRLRDLWDSSKQTNICIIDDHKKRRERGMVRKII